jgi:predicted pyridoxine 5'-phosphate oxidase superfamily flavin-nucleotide-binding protein
VTGDAGEVTIDDLRPACEGVVPPVLATADAHGVPNVTYLSCAHVVDGERIALSNQFFSKTARNVMENPRASLLLIDPRDYGEYRVTLQYERTDRHGPAFEALRRDVDTVAALQGMQDVFRLRAADIYRVLHVEHLRAGTPDHEHASSVGTATGGPAEIAELSMRLGRAPDLDTLVATALRGLDDLLGFRHSILMLVDETGNRLYTIASHGYEAEGVGSEVAVGEGTIGVVADQCRAVRVANVTQVRKYARAVRASFEAEGTVGPGAEIPMPGLELAEAQLAVPAMAMGRLVGVLMVESGVKLAYDDGDEAILAVVAGMLASAIEIDLVRERTEVASATAPERSTPSERVAVPTTQVRFFAVDGSVFLGTDYLIKGVAGRILWSLVGQYVHEGREDFTNREVRLDPSLDLPEYRDNLESRLILLKRRLDEREAPIRIEKTGRGRFRLVVDAPLQLDAVTAE